MMVLQFCNTLTQPFIFVHVCCFLTRRYRWNWSSQICCCYKMLGRYPVIFVEELNIDRGLSRDFHIFYCSPDIVSAKKFYALFILFILADGDSHAIHPETNNCRSNYFSLPWRVNHIFYHPLLVCHLYSCFPAFYSSVNIEAIDR